ncbi:MAG TPA: zinc-binding dehydrogenase, partial [Pseudorhizobium sp.]|nr:zinc-binding dehydrogenase [Pseudorhizobium sp.]
QMGAEFTVNYKREENWGKTVMDWTGGRGVDHVVEVGGPGTLSQSIQAVALGGRITLIGVLTGRSGEVPTAMLMGKQVVLSGIIVGNRRHQKDFVRALDTGIFKPVIDRVFSLEQLADAFRYEESGSHFGKIGIEW